MADSFWKLEKDSTFNTELKCAKILYHSNLNVVLVITIDGDVLVFDGTSGAELHKTKLSGTTKDAFLDGIYVGAHNKLILTNGEAVGMRSDYNGILLFDTILQPIVQKFHDQVEIELPLFEAQLIYQAMKQLELPTAESVIDLINKLEVQIAQNGNNASRDPKAEKWDTICLKSTQNSMKWVASTMASELRRQNRYIPALSIASSINERLNCLLPPLSNNTTIDRSQMFSEANRRETFTKWPHMDYKWALPDQMAQAGFYHQPNTIGDDRAMCFTCVVCLVCWEPTDEPWSEHERHAPTCPFVRGEYTQNVPLSTNYATAPALSIHDRFYFGSSSLSSVLPTFSKKGLITLYSISRFMKVIVEFHVPCALNEYAVQPASQSNIFCDMDEGKSLDVILRRTITENLLRLDSMFAVTACSILSISTYNKYMLSYENYVEKTGRLFVEDIQLKIPNSLISPCLVVGLKRVRHHDASAWPSHGMADGAANDNPPKDDKCQLLLAVYDFHYKEVDDSDSSSTGNTISNERTVGSSKTLVAKKSGTGTGTAVSRNKDCEYYSTKIYEATTSMLEDIGLMETESTSPNHTISVNNSLQSSASFVFPPLEPVQMTSNTTVNLTEAMDSTLSSTNSTGTISPSEEKPRDPKKEGEVSDDAATSDETKNPLITNEAMDLDKEVTLVQYFRILDQCSPNFEISGLHPLFDGQHILVIIKNNGEGGTKQYSTPDDAIGGMLLLYQINFNNSVLCLEESYSAKKLLKTMEDQPKEFIMLPTFLKQDESYWPYSHIPMGVLLTASGELLLINLRNLDTVSTLSDNSTKFISVVYCDLLEKLCACDEAGRLHYISVLDRSFPIEQPFFNIEGSRQNNDEIIQHFSNKFSISPNDLKTLLRLTYFENVTPCYLANVPSCWNEVKQAQKQRRHPQLLQHADGEQHTRSWKLQIGERTWDEHVFELTLMQSMCIGHVDVKFSLHASCQLVPNIQVTLLRLKNEGNMCDQSCKSNRDAPCAEGSSTSASTTEILSNPVNSKEYHLKHNTEVLCGPVNLVKYLDLSKRSGTITLTSPKLFRSCCRTLLLHVKALGGITQETTGVETKPAADKPSQESKKKPPEQVNKQYSKFYSSLFVPEETSVKKEQPTTVNISKKPSAGCDWIHELSVTIRKPKRVDVAGEKSTRCDMLENLEFVDNLLEAFCTNSDPEYRLIAMDILVWIASIRMCRFRPVDADISMQQLDFAQLVEHRFAELIKYGFIEGSRKLAHKVTKLLVACSMGCKDVQDSDVVRFDFQLLKILLDCIPQTLQCWSAGAFRWFFQLFLYVLPPNRNHFINTSQKCFTLLNHVAKELHSRRNPYHLLLRTRYGLYGNPFESELFDTEPIIPGRSSSMPVTYANLVAGPNVVFNSAANNESGMNGFFSLLKPLNSKEFGSKGVNQKLIGNSISNSKTDLSFLTGISASHYMKGLLEVEPLHFTCHATSDGTRVERVDTDFMDEEAIVNYYGPTSTNAPFQTAAFSPYQGGKKTEKVYIFQDLSDMTQTPLETVMSEEAFQHFKMSVIPKIKQSTKNLDVGKQLIVIDNHMAGPSYVPTPIYHDKVTYSEVHSGFSDNSLSWQQLLVPPPQQVIIIDRMHSGAKRFVVLDFGFPICLTDMLVPSCLELLSLSIDIWTQSEEIDGRRLVVASDINSKMLIMSDIQPPPICRFLKITAIGRYGMSTTKCRIPIGTFYGHSYVLPSDGYAEENAYFRPHSDVNVQMLCGMMEDVQCRYGLVCSKLRDQLTPFLTSEIPNVNHMNHYLNKGKTKTPTEVESHRVNSLYKDCITFQHQMNLVRNVMNRMNNSYPSAAAVTDLNVLLSGACTDKLRNLTEALLDLLLYIVYELGSQTPPVLCSMLGTEVCQDMFSWLCVGEDSRTQVSTCTLLVRLFGVQPGWGEFLMNTFTELYSSNHHSVFPQDRVFVLLSYLGRKSIMSSGNQNYVIEYILKALLKEFLPLIDTTAQGFIRGKLDLPLLSWLLMFFLQCVEVLPSAKSFSSEDSDSIEKDNDTIRWNFIQSEVPIHRKRMMIDKKGWSRHFRRAIQKKVLQSKQQLKDLEAAKKNFQVTTQALGKLSSHTMTLKQELHNILNSIPLGAVGSSPKLSIKTKSVKEKMMASNNAGSSTASWTDKPTRSSECVIVPPVTPKKVGVDKVHCLPVIRALVAFMLHVDVTCNVDLFLISCKVMSCLLQISNVPIALNEMLNEDQLVKLLQMAVWCENGQSMCGGKWTSHAITCLLQDIMDKTPKTRFVVRATRRKSSTPLDGSSSGSTDFTDITAMDADATDSFSLFVNNTSNISTEENPKDFLLMCSSTPKCDNSQLPSLMESDDSEVDENLEEYLMDERCIKETSSKNKNNLLPNVSVALDSRLEFGVEENIEVLLRNLADKSSCNLLQSVNAMLSTCSSTQSTSNQFKMDHPAFLWTPPSSGNNVPSTAQMFSSAFDRLLTTFNVMGSNNNLEETLSLWLLLINKSSTEQDSFSNAVPLIPISGSTISNIMTVTYRRSPPSIRLWFLLFKTLTYVSNLPPEENQYNKNVASGSCSSSSNTSNKSTIAIPEIIVQHEAFTLLLADFLSSPFVDDMAGENVVRAFSGLLHRLADHIRANPAFEELGMLLKERLLEVLCSLLSSSGAIVGRRGPLDAQIAFLSLLQDCEFNIVGFSQATDIIMKLGDLVLPYVQHMNAIKCCTSVEIPANAASCFAPPALKSATSAQNADGRRVGPFSRDFLIMQLFRFATKLLKLSSEPSLNLPSEFIIQSSQTDESKVVEQQRSVDGFATEKSSLADVVLRHDRKMYQFLSSINSCYRSSLNEVTDWHVMPPLKPLTNHSTVADGIFHFLNAIFLKSSASRQKIDVFCGYLSNFTSSYTASDNASMQLSDPMLWLLMRVLNEPNIVLYFIEKGGMEVVCANLQRCFSVILNQHSSTVSSVMQYMYGPHGFNVPSAAAKGKKKHTVDRNDDGLINFAPLGTIVLDNPAAQPADVLLMSATPHRRARSAAWSYHFYPEEKSVDLKILLPCAILLKEVHLQPHHMSLATSPKAVSLEISRGGGEYIPIQAPVRTSGLAFLHMTLYQPEVVTSVLIRCYKPKEASGIGLSQVRLLGYSAFGDRTWRNTYNDLPNDYQLMNTATSWLRLYHHNLLISRNAPDVEYLILESLALSTETVTRICGLFLLPSPLPKQFNRVLVQIMLKLGLHSKTLCLAVIKTVLRNGICDNYRCGKPVDPATTNSVFELLHQLCCSTDQFTVDRVTMMLEWLAEIAELSMKSNHTETPIPTYIYCISCILWASQENPINYDLPALLTSSLFDRLLKWSAGLPVTSALKRAVDRVLCSMYVIKPENYIGLLENLSIILNLSTNNSNENNVSDDLKEKQHHFTHIKQPFMELSGTMLLVNSKHLCMSEKMFTTLSTVSQSHISAQQLIGCGFLALLVDVIIEFCHSNKSEETFMNTFDVACVDNYKTGRILKRPTADDPLPMSHIDTISNILQFFSELCWEGSIRTWLGSSEICGFWEELLQFLCITVPKMHVLRNDLPSESLLRLEDATIKFFSRCCWCYPNNQKTLAHIVYKVIDAAPRRYSKYNLGITDFTRRVLLQLILETEKIFVLVESDLPESADFKANVATSVLFPPPAAYPSSSRHQLLYMNTTHTCVEIINQILGNHDVVESSSASAKMADADEEVGVGEEVLDEICDKLTLSAGVTAKDKRLKDALAESLLEGNIKRMKKASDKGVTEAERSSSSRKLTLWVPTEAKYANVCPDLTISQMLQLLLDKGDNLESPMIKFKLVEQREEAIPDENKSKNLLEEFAHSELPSVLKEFVDTRGLEMVAHRLPMVYPTHYLRMVSSVYDSPICHDSDQKWVKLDVNDDIYEEVMEDKSANATMSMGVHPEKRVFHANENMTVSSVIPPHSLMAFGQFLKLPNYAELLIRSRKQAQCLLRLVLGGGDESDFNIACDPAKSLTLDSLPTLPFEILRYLFKSSSLTSDEALALRVSALKHGAIHVVLACLAIFTHQPEAIPTTDTNNQHMPLMMALKQSCSSVNSKKPEDKSHQYWAKGTGFGTGSTTQSWNVEQALGRQRFEEEHVTIFLQILASYMNPDFKLQDEPLIYLMEELLTIDLDNSHAEQPQELPQLPNLFVELIEHSCLLPALASYLRNDSVLDMARHIPLYRSILMLMRVMAVHPQMVTFLLPVEYAARQTPASSSAEPVVVKDQTTSLVELLQRMKTCVETYISRLKKNKENGEGQDSVSFKVDDEDESGEGLATLIPDIKATAKIVEILTEKIISKNNAMTGRQACQSTANTASIEEVYLRIMKKLQFDSYDMIVEDAEGLGYMFNVSYHFEPNVHSDGEKHTPQRMRRLAQEAVTLTTSLPLSYSSSVFVRCDTDRLDVMKVLITGPAETPYANGCFEFDVYFPPDYPNAPMLINLETTGRHSVRFNPNLYNDGKVCLSVLNTWHGRPEEKWNAQTSSFLQVLVSIQSLILVSEPYFNEPGYERSRGTASGNQSSREYNANIMQATVRWAMLDQIRNPSPCFKDIIHTHFWLKRNEITRQIATWISEIENEVGENSKANRTLSHGTMSLKCHYKMLCEEFAKLTPPPGMEEASKSSQFDYKPPSSPTTSTALSTPLVTMPEPVLPVPTSSDDDDEQIQDIIFEEIDEETALPIFKKVDKLMAELD